MQTQGNCLCQRIVYIANQRIFIRFNYSGFSPTQQKLQNRKSVICFKAGSSQLKIKKKKLLSSSSCKGYFSTLKSSLIQDILDIKLILHGTIAKNPFNREGLTLEKQIAQNFVTFRSFIQNKMLSQFQLFTLSFLGTLFYSFPALKCFSHKDKFYDKESKPC